MMSFSVRPLREEKRPWPFPKLPWKKALALSIIIARPLFALGKRFMERREHAQRVKRIVAVSIAGGVAILIIALAFSMLISVGMVSMGDVLETAGAPVAVDTEGFTNILILGQGNDDHDGIDLTDTVIVASIDSAKSKGVAMLSLPRDLYFLHTEKMGKGKLNTLWRDTRITLERQGIPKKTAELQSLQELGREIGQVLGLTIHYSVKVDFAAFEKIIDALGGIDLLVKETIHDTEYPGPNFTYTTFHIDAGLQHLDGATALQYARSRHTTSDFDRSGRQQEIIVAAMEKARESGLLKKAGKLMDLYAILSEHVLTDLGTRQLITFGNVARGLQRENIIAIQLNTVNGLYGEPIAKGGMLYSPPRDLFEGASVLLPVSIPEFPVTWKQVRALSELIFRHRDQYIAPLRIAIFNGGAPEGSARLLYRECTKFGFEVVEVSNVPGKRKLASSFLVHRSPAIPREKVQFIASLLSLPIQELSETLQSDLAGKEAGDVSILLGEDFDFRSFQDLIPLAQP